MVEIEFTTEDMVNIENHMNNYFNGHKPPQISKEILKLLKKINVIREGYEEIDEEDMEIEE